jgi:hypothetical protein
MGGWYIDDKFNLRRDRPAKNPSTSTRGAVSPTGEYIPYSYVMELREENARLISQHRELIESKDLRTLALENEVLAAIIDGHLFKERITEVVKLVLFQELDAFLNGRFTKGSTYVHTQVTEVQNRLDYLNNNPEQNHGP